MLMYDSKQKKNQIETISSKWGLLIFSASIINRFEPIILAYEYKSKIIFMEDFTKIKDFIWRIAITKFYQKDTVQHYIDMIESKIPDVEDENWITLSGLFQNATIALAYTLDILLTNEYVNALCVSEHIYECVYNYVDFRENAKDYSVDFTSDPVVQQELSRQQRDLQELAEFDYEHCDEHTWHEFVERFRKRSEGEPALSTLSNFIP